jgi:hypothetical protein
MRSKSAGKRRFPLLWLETLLLTLACQPSLPEGTLVIPKKQPEVGYAYALPGPMPKAGPYKTYVEALFDACPRLLSLPNAVGGRQDGPHTVMGRQEGFYFKRYVDVTTEYCAWVYYTPQGMYEMSWVGTDEEQSDSKLRHCNLPRYVHDPRYRDEEIMYVFAIHGHPAPSELTEGDVAYIIKAGEEHGKAFYNKDGQIHLGIIAFYSKGEGKKVSCDGFFQYTPFTGELQKWSRDESGEWRTEKMGKITYEWKEDGSLDIHFPGKRKGR